MQIFSPDNLFNFNPTGTPPVPFDVMTGLFVLLLLICAFAYWRRAKLAPDNAPKRRLIRRSASAGMWTSALGIFLALMRYLEVPYLSLPVLLLLLGLLMIGIVGYYVYEISERYPMAVWRIQHSEIQRRYRPQPRKREEPQPVRPNRPRGKQRRARR